MSDPIDRLLALHSPEAARAQLESWLYEYAMGEKANRLRVRIPHYVTRTFCGCKGGHEYAYATRAEPGSPLLCPTGKVIGSQPDTPKRKKKRRHKAS